MQPRILTDITSGVDPSPAPQAEDPEIALLQAASEGDNNAADALAALTAQEVSSATEPPAVPTSAAKPDASAPEAAAPIVVGSIPAEVAIDIEVPADTAGTQADAPESVAAMSSAVPTAAPTATPTAAPTADQTSQLYAGPAEPTDPEGMPVPQESATAPDADDSCSPDAGSVDIDVRVPDFGKAQPVALTATSVPPRVEAPVAPASPSVEPVGTPDAGPLSDVRSKEDAILDAYKAAANESRAAFEAYMTAGDELRAALSAWIKAGPTDKNDAAFDAHKAARDKCNALHDAHEAARNKRDAAQKEYDDLRSATAQPEMPPVDTAGTQAAAPASPSVEPVGTPDAGPLSDVRSKEDATLDAYKAAEDECDAAFKAYTTASDESNAAFSAWSKAGMPRDKNDAAYNSHKAARDKYNALHEAYKAARDKRGAAQKEYDDLRSATAQPETPPAPAAAPVTDGTLAITEEAKTTANPLVPGTAAFEARTASPATAPAAPDSEEEDDVAAFKAATAPRRRRIRAALVAVLGAAALVGTIIYSEAIRSEKPAAAPTAPAPATPPILISQCNAQIKLVVAGLNSQAIPFELPALKGETYLGDVTFSAPGKPSLQRPCRVRRPDKEHALASCDDLPAAEMQGQGPVLTLSGCKKVEKK